MKTIFIVDDNATSLTVAENIVSEHYRTIALSSAARMFKALEKFSPDLILLDVKMPEMDGFEALKILKSREAYAEIPVIFLTSLSDSESEAHGIALGATDFIMKPFSEPVLLNRIKNHLGIDEIIRQRTAQLTERTAQLLRMKNGIVFTMASLVENRDSNTGGHIGRTTVYMKTILDSMMARGIYSNEINGWDIDLVISSASLHDVRKIAIPDSILNKPGRLTDEEFRIMQTHALEGERIIDGIIKETGEEEFLGSAKKIAAYHHEKWNGTGYPYKLSGTDIPLQGRIMAVVDVYDALVSERPYKKAFTHEEAVGIIMEDAGRHFDESIADAFNAVGKQINAIRMGIAG